MYDNDYEEMSDMTIDMKYEDETSDEEKCKMKI